MLSRREFLEFSVSAATGALMSGCSTSAAVPIMQQTSHRPWPLPRAPWILTMRWHDLLFLHWPIRPQLIRPLVPSVLELETFDGWCWLGVVPFRMTGVRPRLIPIPFSFPELNVRTYVNTRGKSGVWFFSLDATNRLAVRAARWLGLPYSDARMSSEAEGEIVHYASTRMHKRTAPAEFIASYRPIGRVYHAAAGSMDHWLTERYCLYAAHKPDRIVYGEIHHPPWPLQPAEVEIRTNTMAQSLGIELPETQPLCHFARYQEVVAWPIVSVDKLK